MVDALYEDLVNPFFEVQSQEHNEDDSVEEKLQFEVEQLQTKNEQLTNQNTALRRNISCLYKTAKLELQTQQDQIQSLKKSVSNLQQIVKHISTKLSSQTKETSTMNEMTHPASQETSNTIISSEQNVIINSTSNSTSDGLKRTSHKKHELVSKNTHAHKRKYTSPKRKRKRERHSEDKHSKKRKHISKPSSSVTKDPLDNNPEMDAFCNLFTIEDDNSVDPSTKRNDIKINNREELEEGELLSEEESDTEKIPLPSQNHSYQMTKL